MAASDRLLSSKGSVPKINPENIHLWTMQIRAFFMRFPGVREAWDAVIPPKETPQQKAERIALHGEAAQKAYSYLVEACVDSPVALNAAVAHQSLDKDLWPNTLRKMLETRFTLQAANRLQISLTGFNSLRMNSADKSGAIFMDRYNQKIAEISSINIEELPTPLLRCTVLKAAVKESFPITHALMGNTKASSSKVLEEKLIEMVVNCEEENVLCKEEQDVTAVANYTQMNTSPRKQFVKKESVKSDNSSTKKAYVRRCFGCDSTEHIVADCPHGPRENPRGGEKRNFEEKQFANKKQSKNRFPLKSSMKAAGKSKSKARNNFFDSNGNSGDESGDSANMLVCIEIDDNDISIDDDVVVVISKRMDEAFQAVVGGLVKEGYSCVDSACNVLVIIDLPKDCDNVVLKNASVNTAGQGGQLIVRATFDWGETTNLKFCPDGRANLLPTDFFVAKQCDIFLYQDDDTKELFCRIRCRYRAINESEYRTVFATRCGGLWWISPAFLEDLIYRRGRTAEEIENFDRLDHEHDLEIEAARNKEAMLVALPWDQRPARMSTMLMRLRQIQLRERTSLLRSDERVRWFAEKNPFGKRILIQDEGVAAAVGINHPPFGEAEETDFHAYVSSHKVFLLHQGEPWDNIAEAVAEEMWLEPWRLGLPVPPPINAPPPPLVAIAAVAVDVSNVVDDDALDNDSNIFYSKDFSSKLVTTRTHGGNLSHKAVPVCFIASSVSVDVLGLMHERTGHFHKRGLIECVRSKIVNGLKIEDKDIRKFKDSD